MKPVKPLLPASKWLLRITMLAYMLLIHGKTILEMQYETRPFYIALAFVLFAFLLLAGGFTTKPSLTVISALLLGMLFIFSMYLSFVPEFNLGQVLNLLLLSVCVYFVSSGNK